MEEDTSGGGGGGGGSSSSEWSKCGGGGGKFSIEERGVVELLPNVVVAGSPDPPIMGIWSLEMTEELRLAGGAGFIE